MSTLPSRCWRWFTHLLGGLLPGAIARRIQVAAFEQDWEAANQDAQAAAGPLWVVLGDSGSQAIGASDRRHGYVLSVLRALQEVDPTWRVVNLSRTGARVADVLDTQLTAMRLLPTPDLVTVAIGTNDVRRRTPQLDAAVRTLLGSLPPGSVVATIPQGVRQEPARKLNLLIRREAAQRDLRVADLWARTGPPWHLKFSADHFHPNDLGYADWTAAFLDALDLWPAHSPGPAQLGAGSTPARVGTAAKLRCVGRRLFRRRESGRSKPATRRLSTDR